LKNLLLLTDASAAQKPKAPSLPKKKDRSNIIGSLVKPKSNVQVDAAAAETKR
jgi:hypothetical protein